MDATAVMAAAAQRLADPNLTDTERADIEALLSELDAVYERNPLEAFRPLYDQQERYVASRARIKFFAAGLQAGKTTIGVADDVIQCLPAEFVPPHLRKFKFWEPPFFCRTIVPGYKVLWTGVIPKTRELVPPEALAGGRWDKAFDKQNLKLNFANGSWIDYMSMEADLDKFGSVTLDRVRFDEEPPGEKGRQVFNQAEWRTARRSGQVCFTLTPNFGLSWLESEVWAKRHEDGYFGVQASVLDNPTIPLEEIRPRMARLTEEERLSIIEGGFSHFEGKVFKEFSDRHVVDPPSREHAQGLDTVVGVDPGINETGVTWVGFDTDNVSLTYAELYLPDHTVEQAAEKIKAVNEEWGCKPRYVIDPSSRNRGGPNSEQVEAAFVREGILVMPGQNAREAGVFEIKRRLQHDPPAAFVSRDCGRLRWEIGRYRKKATLDGSFDVEKDDDDCLVAGTLVQTPTGAIPIEDIREGDAVLTRKGARRVLYSGRTHKHSETVLLETADGHTLRGTANHPIWVEGQGFTPMGSVRYGDILLVCPEAKSSNSTASGSDATPTRPGPALATTSAQASPMSRRESGRCTRRYGEPTTVPSRTAVTSTTLTAIHSTTPSTTSPASAPRSTSPLTGLPNAAHNSARRLTRSARWPQHGTAARRAWNGTVSTAVTCSPTASLTHSFASTVPLLSSPRPLRLASAPTPVSRHGDETRAWMTSTGHASSAASPTAPTATQSPAPARTRVVGVSRAPRSATYNLTVDGEHEYFANGILVHNCLDSWRYAHMERPYWSAQPVRERRRPGWIPGTAPAYGAMRPQGACGPMGQFS